MVSDTSPKPSRTRRLVRRSAAMTFLLSALMPRFSSVVVQESQQPQVQDHATVTVGLVGPRRKPESSCPRRQAL
jgi:hypothetical protein